MFLKETNSGDLVEVLDLKDLFDPYCLEISGRFQRGEEPQDPGIFSKSSLVFPSGEPLPGCWIDAHYRAEKLTRNT